MEEISVINILKKMANRINELDLKLSAAIRHIPRPSIHFINEHFKDEPNLIGVEIGVSRGENALSLLRSTKTSKLYCIDPYLGTGGHSADDRAFAVKNLSSYPKRAVLIEKMSKHAAKDVKQLLDYVYIDGDHTYEGVSTDCEIWWEKLQARGILCGHDYDKYESDVVQAVNDFAKKVGREIHQETDWYWDWCIYK